MDCWFHHSPGSLKVRFLNPSELFTLTKLESGGWNNRGKHSDIPDLFYKKLERPRREVSPGIKAKLNVEHHPVMTIVKEQSDLVNLTKLKYCL